MAAAEQAHSLVIEYATSGKAKCKFGSCRLAIDKGATRIGRIREGSADWYRMCCSLRVRECQFLFDF